MNCQRLEHDAYRAAITWTDGHRSEYPAVGLFDNNLANGDPHNHQRLETFGHPPEPSSSAFSAARPASSAKCPPDESPAIPIRFGSSWYLPPFARRNRMVHLQSSMAAGNLASPLKR